MFRETKRSSKDKRVYNALAARAARRSALGIPTRARITAVARKLTPRLAVYPALAVASQTNAENLLSRGSCERPRRRQRRAGRGGCMLPPAACEFPAAQPETVSSPPPRQWGSPGLDTDVRTGERGCRPRSLQLCGNAAPCRCPAEPRPRGRHWRWQRSPLSFTAGGERTRTATQVHGPVTSPEALSRTLPARPSTCESIMSRSSKNIVMYIHGLTTYYVSGTRAKY